MWWYDILTFNFYNLYNKTVNTYCEVYSTLHTYNYNAWKRHSLTVLFFVFNFISNVKNFLQNKFHSNVKPSNKQYTVDYYLNSKKYTIILPYTNFKQNVILQAILSNTDITEQFQSIAGPDETFHGKPVTVDQICKALNMITNENCTLLVKVVDLESETLVSEKVFESHQKVIL